MLVIGNESELITRRRDDLKRCFKMKGLGKLMFFLGIEFTRSDMGIYMYQRKYALEFIELGFSGSNPSATPLEVNRKLTYVEYDNMIENEGTSTSETDKLLPNPKVFQ